MDSCDAHGRSRCIGWEAEKAQRRSRSVSFWAFFLFSSFFFMAIEFLLFLSYGIPIARQVRWKAGCRRCRRRGSTQRGFFLLRDLCRRWCLCVQVWRRKETGEMETKDYTQEIIDIIRSNTSPAVMSSRLEDYHANDLAEVLKKLTVQERCKLYRILD